MEKNILKIILILILVAFVVTGGVLLYKYRVGSQEKIYIPIKNQDFSKLNKDNLLHKLFPNLVFKDGVATLPADSSYENLKLYLKDSIEDYFTSSKEKDLLLVVNLEGVATAGGLYHTYLGLFDGDGKLLTPASSFGSESVAKYDFYKDKAQFGADKGEFSYYDCNGEKYILFVSHFCPNGSCCNGTAILYKAGNGQFEKVQEINQQSLAVKQNTWSLIPVASASGGANYASYKLIPSNDQIVIKKVPDKSGNGKDSCPETDYKILYWNSNSCRFE